MRTNYWNSDTSAEQIHKLFVKELRLFIHDTQLATASNRTTPTEWLDKIIRGIDEILQFYGNNHISAGIDMLEERLNGHPVLSREENNIRHIMLCRRISTMKALVLAFFIINPTEPDNYTTKLDQIIERLENNGLWRLV